MMSIFDLVGPVMMGPSSSHTAGAVRIGYISRQIFGKKPQCITLMFNPVLMKTYVGHLTHVGLVAGALGYREDDPAVITALKEAKSKNISIE